MKEHSVTRIQLSKLVIPDYQRKVEERRVTKYVRDFNPMLVGVIKVSPNADGTFNIVDGQHRVSVLRTLGFQECWCEITKTENVEQEAALFVKLQTERKNVKPIDRYRALIQAGDEKTLLLKSILDEFGLVFVMSGGAANDKKSGITSVHRFSECLEQYGPRLFRNALRLTLQAWPQEGDIYRFNGELFQGILFWLIRYEDQVSTNTIAERLSTVSPKKLLRDAKANQESSSDSTRSIARSILSLYNNKRSTRRIDSNRLYERVMLNKDKD